MNTIYPPNPVCCKRTMLHDATLAPFGKLPARVVFRCSTNSTHTRVLPLLCTWEEYTKYRESNHRTPLQKGFVKMIELVSYVRAFI